MILDSEYMRFNNLRTGKKTPGRGEQGFSLIEIVVYVALLGTISVFLSNSLIQIANVYQRMRAEREASSNARTIMDMLARSIAQAKEVYTPTSKFDDDAGQLSLVSALGTQPGHANAYVDFWPDNGVILTRAEGGTESILSASSVRITRLRFQRIIQVIGRDAVKITLRVDSANARFPASVTLNATTALRGNY